LRIKRAYSFLAKATLLVASVLASLLILEAGIRVFLRVTGNPRVVVPDAVTGWRLAPNVRKLYRREEVPYWIVTNSRGLRDREHTLEKQPGKYRIIVLGDSMTFGAGGVESKDRFTDVLENSDPRLEVINLGVPAYSTDQEYLYLKREGLLYHPDLVILCIYRNDFEWTFRSFDRTIDRPKGHFVLAGPQLEFRPPRSDLIYRLTGRSLLFAIVDAELRRLGWGQYAKPPSSRLDGSDCEGIFRLLLSDMWQTCRSAGAEFAVVYLPSKGQMERQPLQEVIEKSGRQLGFAVVDLTGVLDVRKSHYFQRDIHINAEGHRVVAREIGERIVADKTARGMNGR
jgi:hypothetical protein